MVEFALAAIVFFCIVIVGFDFIRWSYQTATAQFISAAVLREAVIGPPARPAPYSTQAAWIEGEIIRRAQGLGLPIQPGDVAICPFSTLTAGTCNSATDDGGNAGDMVAVVVSAPLSGFIWTAATAIGQGRYNVRALAVARNEPWNG